MLDRRRRKGAGPVALARKLPACPPARGRPGGLSDVTEQDGGSRSRAGSASLSYLSVGLACTSITGTGDNRATPSATLPSIRRPTPRLPCVPITISSAAQFLASSTI